MISYREVASQFLHWKMFFLSALYFSSVVPPSKPKHHKGEKSLITLESFSLPALVALYSRPC